jgi:hypothetical protein
MICIMYYDKAVYVADLVYSVKWERDQNFHERFFNINFIENVYYNSIIDFNGNLICIQIEPKMYNISSIENGWADLAQIFFNYL